MTTLNDAFETELAQEDAGYDSWSENFNITTPLSRALRIYHVTTREDLSFDPAHFGQPPTTLVQHEETSQHRYRHHSFTCCLLVVASSDDESHVRSQHSNTDTSSPAHISAGLSSPEHYNQHHMYTQNLELSYADFKDVAWDDVTPSIEEHFQTAPL